MTTFLQSLWRGVRRREPKPAAEQRQPAAEQMRAAPAIDIVPNDPLIAYFLSVPGAVEVERLRLESPALQAMRAAGVQVVVPLVSQGELIGVISLGPRLSQQDYTSDDRALLSNLAVQAAPAVRVAQLVRQQQVAALQRERIEQELRVAHLVQQTLLPHALPQVAGYQLDRYYQPAREVGGDFYDFIDLPDGRLGLVIGDVTDKGVPAALVMATTRSVLRAAAEQLVSPGAVLKRVNDLLCDEIPPNMFVTCLYAILDVGTGRLHYANAGHDLPYRRGASGANELRACGMPLGLMPGMLYEENELTLAPGECVLFYSDGLVEAHNPAREMFSFDRLQELLASLPESGAALVARLLDELGQFTGAGWEQEDDITLVVLGRNQLTGEPAGWRTLAEWTLPSEEGNERLAMEQVGEALSALGLPARRLERLKTAVAEATMNAIEHGNGNTPELPVEICVRVSDADVVVEIVDQGGQGGNFRGGQVETPDLSAKLEGEQSPRGWGLFLIKSMVDEMRVTSTAGRHCVELIMHREQHE
jgi:serine phosphatase RsbU (regulator of sigma subunit)/anti-sigma regulatory factor (Ser/Thr protein kinase)